MKINRIIIWKNDSRAQSTDASRETGPANLNFESVRLNFGASSETVDFGCAPGDNRLQRIRGRLRSEMKPHKKFFSSLNQVEKRLKVENAELPPPLALAASQRNYSTSTDSEVSPLYLDFDPTNKSCESETPQAAFLSNPPSSTPSLNVSDQLQLMEAECDEIDELIELLGLSGLEDGTGCCNSCNCQGSFYEKIVGVKGPKCDKEVERLNGWIEFFYKGDESEKWKEPFKLSHLLLGKASFLSQDNDPELEFPSTLDEFLKNDPPL